MDEGLFPRRVKVKLMGGTRDQVSNHMAQYISETFSISVTSLQWSSLVIPLESAYFARGCPLMPAVHQLVQVIKDKGALVAVATSSSRDTFEIKSLPHQEFFSSFDVITCGDDHDCSNCHTEIGNDNDFTLVKGKPDPSIFRTARYLLNRTTSHPGIVLEDSPNGVVAALRSGHSCVWVPGMDMDGGFGVIDEILSEFESEFGNGSEKLWVYRAESLQELLDIFTME